ncbi:MAG: OmpA family protein [Cytophagaceae bacterium]|nr:OmpA family protein [Cytophagaceae bacterium]
MRVSMFRPILLLLLAVGWLTGCNSTLQTFKQGQKKFNNGEYELAIKDFQQSVAHDPARVNYLIAESYRLSNRLPQSAEFYEKALTANLNEPAARYHYGFALKSLGRYKDAAEQLERFTKTTQRDRVMADKARREIQNLTMVDSLYGRQKQVAVRNLEGINTTGAEFSPILQGSNLLFTASRKEVMYKTNGQPMLGLYKTPLTASTETGPTQLFSETLFQENLNEGTPAFTRDGKLMVFARGNTGKKRGKGNTADVDLYVTRLAGATWSEPELVAVSDSAAWDAQPAFSNDGRTLYFCSNRPGGAGGIDIYRANVDNSGRFGRPVNMGRDINTPGDDMFPYVSAESKLYFASDGHPGLGRLDLFVATRNEGEIVIENLGQPFNSRFDDFALVLADTVSGYFSSNREGGKGDDDIYFFEPAKEPIPTIAQKPPVPKKDTTTTPTVTTPTARTARYFLAGTVVDPANRPLDSVRVRVLDASQRPVGEALTLREGKFGPFPVNAEQTYTIVVEKPTYFTKRDPFSTVGKTIPVERLVKPVTDTTFYATVSIDKPAPNLVINKLFAINPIYYNLDKDNIRTDASPELDKIVQILKDNPQIKLELGSHTDVRGSDAYNEDLSQRRAKSAVDYIISRGIEPNRITAKGYGERQLIIKNAKTEEQHQTNRRTEFKVLK